MIKKNGRFYWRWDLAARFPRFPGVEIQGRKMGCNCKKFSNGLPMNKNTSKITSAISNSRIIICRCRLASMSFSTDRSTGMFPSGSIRNSKRTADDHIPKFSILYRCIEFV